MEGWDVELIVTMNPRIGYMERDGFDSENLIYILEFMIILMKR